eukprot:TRINITY_DN2443_c0_g1_i1.p2 TRINITY_DN2443_c0_g1~~TRINITY_DN2443_c0_g1_i1.p2  ORF type:complete len:132 (+),score=61.03 TRINITY_DN2443_c0_g1_i1:143-538(+)
MADDRVVSFDKDGNMRILDEEKFNSSIALQEQAIGFVDKLQRFQKTVTDVVSAVEAHRKSIEKQKLKAVGLRLRVAQADGQEENRRRKEAELRQRIREKQSEYDRYVAEHESLVKVVMEQKEKIEKLSFME